MHRLTLFIFGMTLALMPAPLASNRDWAWSPLGAIAGLLLVAAAISLALDPGGSRRLTANLGALGVPIFLVMSGLGWALVQLYPGVPESWVTSISAAAVLGQEVASHTVAFDREAALTGLMRLLTNIAFFLLGATLCAGARDARRVLGTIVSAASVYTLYAMTAQLANSQAAWTEFHIWTPSEVAFTGTFINRNNYATYAGTAAVVALCLALKPGQSYYGETARQRWRRRIALTTGTRAVWLATALVLIVGVLFSASRAGGISLALAVLSMAFLYTSGVRRIATLVAIVLVVALVPLVLPSAVKMAERLVSLAANGDDFREEIYAITLQAIALRPFTGWGLNSFSSVYSILQPPSLPAYYDKAHNTYLEMAFDLGIPAASFLILAVVWIVVRCLRGFYERSRDPELAGVGFIVAVLAGFHAFFDFSLQIPAMACTFFAILGIAWAQSWSGRRPGSAESAEAN